MKNIEVQKKINNKLMLQRISYVGKVGIIAASSVAIGVGTGVIASFITRDNSLQVSSVTTLVTYLFLNKMDSNLEISYISSLKNLRQELQSGFNRFENTSKDEFEEKFNEYKKKFVKSKV